MGIHSDISIEYLDSNRTTGAHRQLQPGKATPLSLETLPGDSRSHQVCISHIDDTTHLCQQTRFDSRTAKTYHEECSVELEDYCRQDVKGHGLEEKHLLTLNA
jgi:hypothetical protein